MLIEQQKELAIKIRSLRKEGKTWNEISSILSIGVKWAKHLAEFL